MGTPSPALFWNAVPPLAPEYLFRRGHRGRHYPLRGGAGGIQPGAFGWAVGGVAGDWDFLDLSGAPDVAVHSAVARHRHPGLARFSLVARGGLSQFHDPVLHLAADGI